MDPSAQSQAPKLFLKKWNQSSIKSKATIKVHLVQKLKSDACQSIPRFSEIENLIFPKKKPVMVYNVSEKGEIYVIDNMPILIRTNYGRIFPHLRVAIEYPRLLKSVFTASGALDALKRGAHLMIRGAWGIDQTYKKDEIVQIVLEGQKIPYAIGIMAISGPEVLQMGDGIAVYVIHILKDGLWEAKL